MSTLFFDIETDGLYDDATRCWCISIRADADGTVQRYYDTSGITNPIGDFNRHGSLRAGVERLEQADRIVGHNIIGFDVPILRRFFGFEPKGEITDTLVLSRLFRPDRDGGHSLRAWGDRLGFPKGDHEDWSQLTEEMLVYCDRDVDVTVATYKALKEEVRGQRWGESIELEHAVAKIISQQEVNGILFDVELANNTLNTLDRMISEIDDELGQYLTVSVVPKATYVSKPYTSTGKLSARASRYAGDTPVLGPFLPIEVKGVDLDSVHQAKKWLKEMGWVPTEFTPTGGAKLTEDSFKSLANKRLGELLSKRVQCRHRSGQIKGWVDNVRKDGRITAGANTNGTPTGRMRHSKVVNVPAAATYPKEHPLAGNLHWLTDDSIPQSVFLGTEMRAMFCSPTDYNIVGHDASGLELRMLAHYMNDPEYTEVLLNGDIHSYNQELAGLHTRASAKTFIYAFIYGAGDAKLGSIVEGGELEGAELRARFLRENPKLNRLINKAKRAARERGYLLGLDGRRIYLRRNERGRVLEHKALNTLLQCAGAVVMKKSMVLLDTWATEHQLDYRKVLDMHDEGQAEVLKAHSNKYAELAVESVVQSGVHFNLNVPLAAEAKIGINWAETH